MPDSATSHRKSQISVLVSCRYTQFKPHWQKKKKKKKLCTDIAVTYQNSMEKKAKGGKIIIIKHTTVSINEESNTVCKVLFWFGGCNAALGFFCFFNDMY